MTYSRLVLYLVIFLCFTQCWSCPVFYIVLVLSCVLHSVVVSQWVTMLDMVNHHLANEGFNTCTVLGDVPVFYTVLVVSCVVHSVVVSQWVTMLDVVNHHLANEGFKTCTIRGDVPVKQRSQTVDMFNNNTHGPTVGLRPRT